MVNKFWLEAKNINCFKDGFRVIKDLNLKIAYSENVILIGPNGSGKSSLIEVINRNIYPVITNESTLKIFDKELINLWELRKRISTVNNDIKNRINPNLQVFDLILSGLYGRYCYISNKSERDLYEVENIMRNMKISKLSRKNFSYLSDGEKQISLIARALINKPNILILDEPIANLDYKSQFFVIDKINELSKLNTKILCVTHNISMITSIYDRVIMLKNGEIIADGPQNKVINNKNLNRLYEIDIEVIKKNGFWNINRLTKGQL
ncbi:ABC transporter ATP-binding protein [Prochlorococcus marinus XMU1411]|uniref:ABC transporter ATP-binding protein n=1 Tax=Prochlorococcus marinus TaxID=1219 RepID=UPI001ADC016E|nr:ABC transporter ATP-binding protein [Prochlorococcus marinus]MBO8243694.1 ABC transporter ATP-binding protein [Prochlorococcus marinus XMU1411]MBW3054801.1 ABC transporter ATP-binding protein [Prochlorococcus marinus str. MU1411]MCR8538388.1 ABC transporter ATP-binding protein [Prochlorococcus marinus CUG1430]